MSAALLFSVFLILINFITWIVYGYDKHQSDRYGSRIPERVLLILALTFGSIGAMIAMECFRHKTDKKGKKIFVYGIPLAFIAQVLIVFLWADYRHLPVYMGGFVLYWVIDLILFLTWKSKHARKNTKNYDDLPRYMG